MHTFLCLLLTHLKTEKNVIKKPREELGILKNLIQAQHINSREYECFQHLLQLTGYYIRNVLKAYKLRSKNFRGGNATKSRFQQTVLATIQE